MLRGLRVEFAKTIYISFGLALCTIGIIFSAAMILHGIRKKDEFVGFWGVVYLGCFIFTTLIFQPLIFKSFDIFQKRTRVFYFENGSPRDNSFSAYIVLKRLLDVGTHFYTTQSDYADIDYLLGRTFENGNPLEHYEFTVRYAADSMICSAIYLPDEVDTFWLYSPLKPISEISLDSTYQD